MFSPPSRTAPPASPLPAAPSSRAPGRAAARIVIATTLLVAALLSGSLLLAALSTLTLLLPRPADDARDGDVLGSRSGDLLAVVHHPATAAPGAPGAPEATLTVGQQRDLDVFRAQLRALPELDPRH